MVCCCLSPPTHTFKFHINTASLAVENNDSPQEMETSTSGDIGDVCTYVVVWNITFHSHCRILDDKSATMKDIKDKKGKIGWWHTHTHTHTHTHHTHTHTHTLVAINIAHFTCSSAAPRSASAITPAPATAPTPIATLAYATVHSMFICWKGCISRVGV